MAKLRADMEHGEKIKRRDLGEQDFLLKKDGQVLAGKERLVYDGNSFNLEAKVGNKEIARLRYRAWGDTISMGKTYVEPDFWRNKINTRLFQHMSDIHPEATIVWTKLDGTNSNEYIKALASGKDMYEAADATPAGRVRKHAGWELDREKSSLAEWKEGVGYHKSGDPNEPYYGAIRLVYKRESQAT